MSTVMGEWKLVQEVERQNKNQESEIEKIKGGECLERLGQWANGWCLESEDEDWVSALNFMTDKNIWNSNSVGRLG